MPPSEKALVEVTVSTDGPLAENTASPESDSRIRCGNCGEEKWFTYHCYSQQVRRVRGDVAKHEGEETQVAVVTCNKCGAEIDVSEGTLADLDGPDALTPR